MRLALYGGRFDPPHLGHLLLAERAREALELDEVWFVPAKAPPHKGVTAPARARHAMTLLATAEHPDFRTSALELERPGASYSIHTVEAVAERRPDAELFYLTGADAYADIASWHRARELVELARMVALPRPGATLAGLEPFFRSRVIEIDAPLVDISSSEVRRRARAGASVRYLVPAPVAAFLAKHRFYRDPDAPPDAGPDPDPEEDPDTDPDTDPAAGPPGAPPGRFP